MSPLTSFQWSCWPLSHPNIPNEHVYENVNVPRPSGPPTLAEKRVLDTLNNEATLPLKMSIERYTLPHPLSSPLPRCRLMKCAMGIVKGGRELT